MDVVLALLLGENLLKWGGGLEEGGQQIRPDGGWADDGKRFSDGRCIGVASRREFVRMGRRSGGGGGKKFDLMEGGRIFFMALKAWQAPCFRDIRRKTGSPVRGSVQDAFRGTFRYVFW